MQKDFFQSSAKKVINSQWRPDEPASIQPTAHKEYLPGKQQLAYQFIPLLFKKISQLMLWSHIKFSSEKIWLPPLNISNQRISNQLLKFYFLLHVWLHFLNLPCIIETIHWIQNYRVLPLLLKAPILPVITSAQKWPPHKAEDAAGAAFYWWLLADNTRMVKEEHRNRIKI